MLATGGEKLAIWDANRSVIKQTFSPSMENITALRFNKVQTNLIALTSRDRSVMLYDIKSGVVIQKCLMKMKTNSICWNPMQPFKFSIVRVTICNVFF